MSDTPFRENVNNSDKSHVVRDPIHGLITLNAWEKRIIDTPEFQRLKRIHQLGTTYYVYPCAEHSRFSHSVGVMHLASRVFDQLSKYPPLNKSAAPEELQKLRNIVRLGALLHDIGHGCFSHAGDDGNIFPELTIGGNIESGHEAYSKLIILQKTFKDILDEFENETGGVTQEDIISALNGGIYDPQKRFICDILSGQLDADKMDYLLRDSYFCGVKYGNYDLERLIISLRLVEIGNAGWILGIDKNGIQAVEEFVFARYWMFVQVYFHKYRRLYDQYLAEFLKNYLVLEHDGHYPKDVDAYIKFDDTILFSEILNYSASEISPSDKKHIKRMKYCAKKLVNRGHHKIVFDPPHHHTLSEPTREQKIEYRRFEYIKKKFIEYIDTLEESEQINYRHDYAKGNNVRNYFDVSVYSNENINPIYDENGELQKRQTSEARVPSIPILTGDELHPVRAIQHYSPLINSVSDRTYSIYRIYCTPDELEKIKPMLDNLGSEAEDYIRNIREKLKNDETFHIEKAREKKDERRRMDAEIGIDKDDNF